MAGTATYSVEVAAAFCSAAIVDAVEVAAAVLRISVKGSSNDGRSFWTVSMVVGIFFGMLEAALVSVFETFAYPWAPYLEASLRRLDDGLNSSSNLSFTLIPSSRVGDMR